MLFMQYMTLVESNHQPGFVPLGLREATKQLLIALLHDCASLRHSRNFIFDL